MTHEEAPSDRADDPTAEARPERDRDGGRRDPVGPFRTAIQYVAVERSPGHLVIYDRETPGAWIQSDVAVDLTEADE